MRVRALVYQQSGHLNKPAVTPNRMTDTQRHRDEHAEETVGAASGQGAGSGTGAEANEDAGSGSEHGEGSSRQRSESWSEAHEAFERLSVEEKAFFLVESAFETMLTGLKEAGDAVKDAMNEAMSDLERRKQEARRKARKQNDAAADSDADASASPEE